MKTLDETIQSLIEIRQRHGGQIDVCVTGSPTISEVVKIYFATYFDSNGVVVIAGPESQPVSRNKNFRRLHHHHHK